MGNSVIYRPAYDAEVEYLESTGTQWIDTGIVPDSNCGVEVAIITTTETQNIPVFGCETTSTYAYKRYHITPNLGKWYFGNNDVELSGGTYDTTVGTEYIIKYNINGEVAVNNSKLSDISMSNVTDIQSICIAKRGPDARTYVSYGIYKYKYFKIYQNSTLVRDFIPVRIGSVGYLYDKVTKQLFANKGTGNFILGNDVSNAVIPQQRCVLYFGNQRSVIYERIYEEYKWLCGDGTAYINTKVKLHFATDSVYIKGSKNGVPTNDARYFGNYSGGQNAKSLELIYNKYVQNDTVSKSFVTDGRFRINPSSEFEFYTTPFSSTTSVSIIYNGDTTIFNVNLNEEYLEYEASNDLILLNTNDTRYCMKADVTNFKVMRSSTIIQDFVPCKLLQSIPAILDGNGIARQAGECGMWDKVSNRFYGNVANSGTFTVKGPKCYEEYDWLEVEVSSSENITMMQLPVNSYEFSFIRKWDRYNIVPHSAYFISTLNNANYTYFTNANYSALIWNGRSTVYTSIKKYSYGGSVSINCDSQNYYIDGESVPIYGECSVIRIDSFIDNPSMVSNVAFSTSAITVDGSIRYVPCKLTHGIPASMDANGIARPAGTCGMWDKVNDKFYGNVASSGTFTVSND